jgi:SpoIID/LytB domain protein
MGADCPAEFLKAHCIVSRSWLLAQLENKKNTDFKQKGTACWTDVCAHRHYDVCADDHCQRYHGIDQINDAVKKALQDTRGEVLMHQGAVCDARFSKCCGGITERFSTAWQDSDQPYLQPIFDGPERTSGNTAPVMSESDVRHFIRSAPPVYCNVDDESLLRAVLPDFDRETTGFFRWTVRLSRERLHSLLKQKTGIDFGAVRALEPVARGPSGRMFSLGIRGDKAARVFGKELEIRRILSDTHLYSSCFVVTPDPEGFVLEGAGWGHGVGMCQIGAAVMARRGMPYTAILSHYFRGAELEKLYA